MCQGCQNWAQVGKLWNFKYWFSEHLSLGHAVQSLLTMEDFNWPGSEGAGKTQRYKEAKSHS